ncbi:glutathione S-transferase [Alcanivorax hongdengensis A-11-3]|uniref:Glutathione S-transferase n=1 Tax=Alcanivorax hongdengensis A-11-3 TaxID=1177179 RepID=L0WDD1_9GAMM|nr:glutathione S-transferase family protein [Alcanivorax hongdengensis]EKF73780.1 glutathione S-transferase [Alcanivorax hongdengensis A-11-3]
MSESEFVLHHYALSPFSEKIRVMLGYTGLEWCSVTTDEMPPRPLLAPLAGGYRKIPVAQIGADVFCDTRTITREIARLSGKPELALDNVSEEVQAFVREADLELFLACILSSTSWRLNIKLFKAFSLFNLLRFFRDRIRIGRTSNVPRMGLMASRARVREHLDGLEARLSEHDFLFADRPNIGDFSAYHGLWFLRDVAESPVFGKYPRVAAWMDRMRDFGHGDAVEMSPNAALKLARARAPRELPEAGIKAPLLGQTVSVAPDDYGQVPVTGTLVSATADSWILARTNPAAGTVHIHFPRQGFALTAA